MHIALSRALRLLYLSTLLVNSGGWLIYLVPVAMMLATWKSMIKYVQLWNGMRSAELERMSPTAG